jgi:hypothetical protein
MHLVRGGALTALGVIVALGCGGSSGSTPPPGGGDDAGDVNVLGPDGGEPEQIDPGAGGVPPNGIFVSASKGLAGADGSSMHPVPTIADGLALAIAQRKPLNVCAEAYAESLTLADGITVGGYYDCSNLDAWKRGTSNAKLKSPRIPGVLAENLVQAARFAGFDIEVPDATPAPAGQPAASSIGMIVRGTKNLEILNVSIRAGKGQDGADGAEPASGNTATPVAAGPADGQTQSDQVELCGNLPLPTCRTVVGGASGGTNACAVGTAGGAGGRGGDGAKYRDGTLLAPTANYRGREFIATATTARGGEVAAKGSDGAVGALGTIGMNGTWSFSAEGFLAGNGTAGGIGQAGQGAGGGGGRSAWASTFCIPRPPPQVGQDCFPPTTKYVYAGTGAGGGAGGCGGVPGSAGSGGGGSFGLFIVDSTITLTSIRIESGKGGRAGKGSLGTGGTPGQTGGTAAAATAGGPGGRGGDGGHAGLSGNGAPGPSIPLVYKGTAPTRTEVTLLPGQGGDGAPALTVDGQTIPAVTGEAKPEHSF